VLRWRGGPGAGPYPGGMATRWVLHTETKGTGATMVPLERVATRRSEPEPISVPRKPKPREPEPPKPRAPRRFRIIDVMTRQSLLEDASAADTVAALRDVRSTVDVNVYMWQEERERWRLLTSREQRVLFDAAAATPPAV
jgi:hypothetical protein